MDRLSDTPPDGDFARYVEQLSASSAAAALAREAGVTAPSGKLPGTPGASATAKPESIHLPAGLSIGSMLRWAVVAFVGLQMLSVLVPGADMLTVPLLVAFAAWIVYRLKRSSSREIGQALRRMAEQAAKEFTQRK